MQGRKDPVDAADRTERRYYLENQIMRLASSGDAEELHRLMEKAGRQFEFPGRLKDDLRNAKNLTIVFNTLLRKSVEFGGVHPVHIHAISERFAIAVERSLSFEEIEALRVRMIDDYCALSRAGPGNGYGPVVSRCVEYIKLMYSDKIGAETLSGVTHVNKSYLCRVFKKETGRTIVEFINRYRVGEAKRLLLARAGDIADIALSVGFDDMNYFSRIFKKYEGAAPSRLRAGRAEPDGATAAPSGGPARAAAPLPSSGPARPGRSRPS